LWAGLFLTQFFMKYRVKVLKTILAEETEVGEGATVLLRCTSKQMIALLRRKYNEDKTCMNGDIEFLFSFDGIGLKENDHFYKP
jgi:hypothetical protein